MVPKKGSWKLALYSTASFVAGSFITSMLVVSEQSAQQGVNERLCACNSSVIHKDLVPAKQRDPLMDFIFGSTPDNISVPLQEVDHVQPLNCSKVPMSNKEDNENHDLQKMTAINPLMNWSSYPLDECETHWYPAGHWTWHSREPIMRTQSIGRQMHGSLAAQYAIWNHQHPSSCHDKKFIVYDASLVGHGIGSILHVAGLALRAALDLDRILVLGPQPAYEWLSGKFCEGMSTLDECYFEPLSSCSFVDAYGNMELSEETLKQIPVLGQDTYNNNIDRVLRGRLESTMNFLKSGVPRMFGDFFNAAKMDTHFYYWWRAQSITYFVRPNLRTLRELDRRRKVLFNGESIEPGTLSVHVRHGDKWKESKLASDETYLQRAEELISTHPNGLQRKIFLSTEDPKTVIFFSKLINWTVQWTNVSREYTDPNMSPLDFASRIGWDEEFLNSLLNLQLALECDGFVGQLSSNWNRLIDELRSVVRCKHDHFYLDVDQGFEIGNRFW